jgi:tetratricopeptide (TPR) repeat protein
VIPTATAQPAPPITESAPEPGIRARARNPRQSPEYGPDPRSQDKADALEYALRAQDLFRRAGHQAGQVLVLNDIGYAHAMTGNYQQALSYCQRAVAATRELANSNWEAATWDSIGYIHHKLGDHQQAIGCYQRAIDLHRKGADRFREADTLRSLGEVWRSAGDPCAACRVWVQALAIFDEIGHPDGETVRAKLASACRQVPAGGLTWVNGTGPMGCPQAKRPVPT